MNSNRIWSVDLVNNNRNINSNMVISNMSDLEQPLLIADISKEKRYNETFNESDHLVTKKSGSIKTTTWQQFEAII